MTTKITPLFARELRRLFGLLALAGIEHVLRDSGAALTNQIILKNDILLIH